MNRIYMDYAATTPTDPRVHQAMEPFWSDKFGNPSSIHSFGQEALEAVETARNNVAHLLKANPSEIVFTGGGTESDNAAIKGTAYALREKGNHIITDAVEHHAVLHACEFMASQGFEVTILPVDKNGIVDPSDVEKAITKNTILLSVMHANNEVGSLQPVSEIGAIAKKHAVLFHTDAVQTFGHQTIDVERMGIDLLSMSWHKCCGPKGVGALYIRKGTPFIPLIHGGGQERGRRSSTHNVTGIVGLGKATEIAGQEMDDEDQRIRNLRDRLRQRILGRIDGVHMNGHPEKRLANNLNISVESVEGEALLMNLDLEGIAASSGSACSSGSGEPSHVLKAIGLPPEWARGSLRLSLGRFSTQEEVDRTSEVLAQVVAHLRSLSSFGRGS
jgi:cysteine desulfurase